MSWNRAGKIFFIASFLAFAAAVLGSREPPILRDYPDWVYQGVLLAKMLTGHPVAGYALRHYPVPNSITTVGLGLLTAPFGWQLAAKLWVLIYFVVAAVTSLYAGSVFGVKDGGLWWTLPVILFLGQLFWFGTISFNLGLCMLLVIACLLYRQRERSAIFAGLLVVCFFVHLIVYASAMVMILLYCMQYRRWRLGYVGLATVPLAIWYFAGRLLTHSNESEHGYAPASHIAVSCLLALVLLGISFFNRRRPIHRMAGAALVVLSALTLGAALVSALIPAAHLSVRALSNIFVLQLKALQPFMLFGFVNISYAQVDERVFSASLHLLHEPLFVALMALDMLVGALILGDIARMLLQKRRSSEEPANANESATNFLWDFITLFGLLYLFCTPNGLGVISLDMRLAQIGLVPALFLLARKRRTALRYASLPCALLMVASVFQFCVSQRQVHMAQDRIYLPHILDYFAAVDPVVVLGQYDALRAGELNHAIFATGMFSQTRSSPPR